MNLLISIVITVYNKERFLKRCIDSCLNQIVIRKDSLEIIVVNDGSTDNSAAILSEYIKRDTRIHVLTQHNQGLSKARNNGVDVARGDYVWFVDADDMISPNSVAQIIAAMEYNPDVIPIYAKTDGEFKIRNEIPTTVVTGKDIILSRKWEHCGPFYIYKRDFLNKYHLRYYPGIYHEDSELTPKMLYYATSVRVVNDTLYTVYRDVNSITQVPRIKRAYDCIIVAERLYNFITKENETNTSIGKVLCSQIALIINNAFNIICYFDKDEQRKFNKFLEERKYILDVLINAPIKYRIEHLLFGFFPRHYVGVYQLIKRKHW